MGIVWQRRTGRTIRPVAREPRDELPIAPWPTLSSPSFFFLPIPSFLSQPSALLALFFLPRIPPPASPIPCRSPRPPSPPIQVPPAPASLKLEAAMQLKKLQPFMRKLQTVFEKASTDEIDKFHANTTKEKKLQPSAWKASTVN